MYSGGVHLMKYFEWEKKYDVGIKKFNDQHKHLLEVLKDVYKAMDDKWDREALSKIINELIKYTQEHFLEEEICLQNNSYPDFDEHKKQHESFTKKMEHFTEQFNSDKQLLHFEIAIFLKNWILQHILEEDKKYGEFLNKKGVY